MLLGIQDRGPTFDVGSTDEHGRSVSFSKSCSNRCTKPSTDRLVT